LPLDLICKQRWLLNVFWDLANCLSLFVNWSSVFLACCAHKPHIAIQQWMLDSQCWKSGAGSADFFRDDDNTVFSCALSNASARSSQPNLLREQSTPLFLFLLVQQSTPLFAARIANLIFFVSRVRHLSSWTLPKYCNNYAKLQVLLEAYTSKMLSNHWMWWGHLIIMG
jgi:hypothetical protein